MNPQERRRRPRVLALALLCVAFLPFVAACGSDSEQLVFMADGGPTGSLSHVAVYVAAARGFYEQEGLDVRIEHASPDGDQIDALEDGDAAFASVRASDLVRHVAARQAAGASSEAVAVALFEQRGDEGYLVREGSGIRTPADFAGRIVGIRGTTAPPELTALLGSAGLDAADVTLEEVGADGLDRVLVGQLDVYPVRLNHEPDIARRLGNDVTVIDPEAFGVETLGSTIVASRSLLESEPATAAAFLRATFRGAYYTSRHIDEAIAIALDYAPDADVDHLSVMLELDLRAAERTDGLGRADEARWQSLIDLYSTYGALDGPLTVEDVFDGSVIDGLYERGELP